MDKIAAILAVVDPTAAEQPAVAKAALIARRCAARLELLVCAAGEAAPGGADRLLEGLAAPLRMRGLAVTTHSMVGAPLHERLLERLRGAPVDLVVKDTHHHALLRRTLITNTDWHLIRGCAQPLLLVKPKSWATHPVILAAVDPGHAGDPAAALDHRILAVAAAFGARLDAELHAVNAYFPATIATAAGAGMPPAIGVPPEALRAENDRRRAEIAALTAPYGVSGDRLHVGPG
ncbi:MAG TPA: hypothetical protein VLU41_14640, partial [Ideonella sp.]|nr:hypothetical protein [Ideonella sp.]